MPLVSVILPSYRMGRFVSEALASVGAQTHKDWEVILVDDCGPEDGTHEAVEAFAKAHPGRRVEYIRNDRNLGCGESRNVGTRNAKGEFLAFLDPDDFWGERHLEDAVLGIGDADLCFCRCRSVDVEGNDLGPHNGARMDGLTAGFPRTLLRENFLTPSSAFVRHDVPCRFGLFTSRRAAMYAADWDFFLRCIAGGASFVFLRQENCFYRRHEGAATSNYLEITRQCALILRENFGKAQGAMKDDLRAALHEHLCRLAYLRISFRRWQGLSDAWEAWWLCPSRLLPLTQLVRALRNNWKGLA